MFYKTDSLLKLLCILALMLASTQAQTYYSCLGQLYTYPYSECTYGNVNNINSGALSGYNNIGYNNAGYNNVGYNNIGYNGYTSPYSNYGYNNNNLYSAPVPFYGSNTFYG